MQRTWTQIPLVVAGLRASILLAHETPSPGSFQGSRFTIDGLGKVLGDAEVCVAVVAGHDLRFVYVNESYRRIHPRARMVGRTYRDVFPEAASAGTEELLRQVIRSETTWVLDDHETPMPNRTVPAWWQGECIPVALSGNGVDAVLILIWDVSHRHLPAEDLAPHIKPRSRVEVAKETLRAKMATLGLTAEDGWTISEEVRESPGGTSWVLRPLHMRRDPPPLQSIVHFERERGGPQ